MYFLADSEPPSKVGLIINKSVGGSVSRHRIARQIRHLMMHHVQTLPSDTYMVIRVLKKSDDYRLELESIMVKVSQRLGLTP
jgi:ribonuclease P protein component